MSPTTCITNRSTHPATGASLDHHEGTMLAQWLRLVSWHVSIGPWSSEAEKRSRQDIEARYRAKISSQDGAQKAAEGGFR